MGIKLSFENKGSGITHTVDTPLTVYIEVTDEHGNHADLNQYSEAVYTLSYEDEIAYTASLGNGIVRNTHFYIITVPASVFFSAQDFTQRFYLIDNTTGKRLSPVFVEPLIVE